MTNSWAELNSPRSEEPKASAASQSTETAPPNDARDPFKPFLAVTIGVVVVIGGLMVASGGSPSTTDAQPAAALALAVEPQRTTTSSPPATDASTTSLANTDELVIHRLYVAAFGREPDAAGFNHWAEQLAGGQSLADVAASFTSTDEFTDQFGTHPVPRQVIELLHQNLLGRAPTATEVEYWLSVEARGLSMADLLVLFAQTPSS